eukprot:m51a1_g7954 hypothetical protein (286) ;mRNA; r:183489-184831
MEAFRKVYPAEYYAKFLAQGVRPDGRPLMKTRKTTVSVGSITSAAGSAFVKLGNTSVVAGVRTELSPPAPLPGPADPPPPKQISVAVDIPALCSPRYRGGRASDEAGVLAQRLQSLVDGGSGSGASLLVNPALLVFDEAGALVWHVHVDLYVLDHDGNIFDALLIALLAALRNTKVRRGSVSETGEARVDAAQAEVPLRLQRHPVGLTFAVVGGSVVADACGEEEALSECSLGVVCDESGALLEVHKPGGAPVADDVVARCVGAARPRAAEVLAVVERALAKAAA